MRMVTIAVDLDGTLRDLEKQIDRYLEADHPDKIDKFREIVGKQYRSLDPVFETKEELYQWMYEERVFELFGMADRLHKRVIDDLNIFAATAKQQGFEVVISSVQRNQSVTATLHWLAKWGCKIQHIRFFNTAQDKVDANFGIYIDDSPEVLVQLAGKDIVPSTGPVISRPRAIKIPYAFTKDIDCPSLDIANGKFDDLYEILGIERVLKK